MLIYIVVSLYKGFVVTKKRDGENGMTMIGFSCRSTFSQLPSVLLLEVSMKTIFDSTIWIPIVLYCAGLVRIMDEY